LRAAEINLQRTEIRAPIEGVIVSEEADLNTFVQRGSTLVVIDDTSKVEVASSLRMDQLYWVLNQRDESVNTASRDYDLPETPAIIEYVMSGRDNVVYRWAGKLLSYNGIGLDPDTRTVPVRVVVEDPGQMVDEDGNRLIDSNGQPKRTGAPALVRGMYVRVKLMIRPKSTLVVIPARALQPGNRVFQFLPDESVLGPDVTNVDASQTDAPERVAGKDESPTPIVEDNFDPNRWTAGKVVLRQNIVPVDSLTLDGLTANQCRRRNVGTITVRGRRSDVGLRSSRRLGDRSGIERNERPAA
jgi:multidrug efflux pump subunit AcrA (membrane-fusion protein)